MGEHPIDRFRRRLGELRDYPPGVVPVPAYLPGTAFFAASAGLFRPTGSSELPPFPFGGWMFVGHNLDAEEPFLRRLQLGQAHGDAERPMQTWRNLYRLLAVARIDPRECFFTNAYVGLKAGANPTGKFAGARAPTFRRWCEQFLLDQITLMQPRAIATLGIDAARFAATLFDEVRDWDTPRLSIAGPRRVNVNGLGIGIVALAHPSGYHASLRGRRFDGRRGIEAEAALLDAAPL